MKKRTPKASEVKSAGGLSPERQARFDELARQLAQRNRELDEEERQAKALKSKPRWTNEMLDALAEEVCKRADALDRGDEERRAEAVAELPHNVIRFPVERRH